MRGLTLFLALWMAVPSCCYQAFSQEQASRDCSICGSLKFRRAVLKAARDGGYSRQEIRKLRTGLLFHGDRIERLVASRAWVDGVIPDRFDDNGRYDIAAIDWEAIADFLIKVMPVILELIETIIGLFGDEAVAPDPGDGRGPDIIIGDNPTTPVSAYEFTVHVTDTCEACIPWKKDGGLAQQVADQREDITVKVLRDVPPLPNKLYPWFELKVDGRTREIEDKPKTVADVLRLAA